MITSYQQRKALQTAEPQTAQLATVGAVYADGITLLFDGETAASTKHYKKNAAITFQAGQRVKVCKICGSYVVEYPIG
ncbi:MAG: hypothetical protein RR022_07410 [Angelakisella sp.]